MQQVNGWPADFSLSEPVARMVANGRPVDFDSLTISSDLESAAPDIVAAGGGGIVAATGDVNVLPEGDVFDAGMNPWNDLQWLANAAEIVVEAGYNDDEGVAAYSRLLTAQTDSLDGSTTEPGTGLALVDHAGRLDRDITIEPLLREYPSLEDFGPLRGAGLAPVHITDRVLRHCGFYATPPLQDGAVLSAPMMGSVIPERGVMRTSGAASRITAAASFHKAPWGAGLGNGNVAYQPDLSDRGHGRLTSPLMVTFNRVEYATISQTLGQIELNWGNTSAYGIRISLASSGAITVRFRENSVNEVVATLPHYIVNESESFSVRIMPSGQVMIMASNGVSVTGEGSLPSRLISSDLEQVHVLVPQNSHTIGGLQVAFTTTTNHEYNRTAHIDLPANPGRLEAFPSQIEKNCLALLKEQAEAELAAMWIDEYGHFRWKSRSQLRSETPSGTLTSLDHLIDLPWDLPVRSLFSRVELESNAPTVTRRGAASITVSDNRGDTIASGETESRFFEPPADQDWHQVEDPKWMGAPSTIDLAGLRRARGSYRGGVVLDDDENEQLAYSSRLHQTWSQINVQRWLLYSEARDLGSGEYIEQSHLNRPDWYGRFAEESLPIIRAKGLTEWGNEVTIGAARGPDLSPVYVHSAGPWIQDANERRELANWLADTLTKPDVVLRDIPIVPDPRIQKGDVFWLEDTTAYDVRLKVMVTGLSISIESDDSRYSMDQSITCRVISSESTTPEVTLADHDHVWDGSTLREHDTFWDGRTLADHDQHPLDN